MNRCLNNLLLLVSLCLPLQSCRQAAETSRPASWATKVALAGFGNLYRVDEQVFRSEQPEHADMKTLEQAGVRSIINLRHTRNDKRKARHCRLHLVHVPINSWSFSYHDLLKALKAIEKAPKPTLLHCRHGSDRTGTVIAAYRMLQNGWTKEEALREFTQGGFGYHQGWFPGMLRLLQSLDLSRLKADLAAMP